MTQLPRVLDEVVATVAFRRRSTRRMGEAEGRPAWNADELPGRLDVMRGEP